MPVKIKILFPFGIFFLIFILISSVGTGILTSYYQKKITSEIKEVEKNVSDYSEILAQAAVDIAELSDFSDSKERLNDYFSKGKEKSLFYRGFFVDEDGNIIAHSEPDEVERVNGSIVADGFVYHLDMILQPILQNSNKTTFSDYNIVEKDIPFTKKQKAFVMEYLYPNADKNGWMITAPVRKKTPHSNIVKTVGTINIIFNKSEIYEKIFLAEENYKSSLMYIIVGAFAFSIVFSFIVYFRYRSIAKKALHINEDNSESYEQCAISDCDIEIDLDVEDSFDQNDELKHRPVEVFDGNEVSIVGDYKVKNSDPMNHKRENRYFVEEYELSKKGSDNKKTKPQIHIVYEDIMENIEPTGVILDAIPVKR